MNLEEKVDKERESYHLNVLDKYAIYASTLAFRAPTAWREIAERTNNDKKYIAFGVLGTLCIDIGFYMLILNATQEPLWLLGLTSHVASGVYEITRYKRKKQNA